MAEEPTGPLERRTGRASIRPPSEQVLPPTPSLTEQFIREVKERSFYEGGGLRITEEDFRRWQENSLYTEKYLQGWTHEVLNDIKRIVAAKSVSGGQDGHLAPQLTEIQAVDKNWVEKNWVPGVVDTAEELAAREASLTCVWCGLVCEDQAALADHEADC